MICTQSLIYFDITCGCRYLLLLLEVRWAHVCEYARYNFKMCSDFFGIDNWNTGYCGYFLTVITETAWLLALFCCKYLFDRNHMIFNVVGKKPKAFMILVCCDSLKDQNPTITNIVGKTYDFMILVCCDVLNDQNHMFPNFVGKKTHVLSWCIMSSWFLYPHACDIAQLNNPMIIIESVKLFTSSDMI